MICLCYLSFFAKIGSNYRFRWFLCSEINEEKRYAQFEFIGVIGRMFCHRSIFEKEGYP